MSKLQQFVESFPWLRNETTPFAQLGKDLAQCTIALISTGGLYVKGDRPFAIANREDVDESYRVIPRGTALEELAIGHEHYDKRHCSEDLNVIFPIERLERLADEGFIGRVAEANYSISGYIPRPDQLFETGRRIARSLEYEGVDAVILVPV
jgi:D-proline reductase (dithiol) PrdB